MALLIEHNQLISTQQALHSGDVPYQIHVISLPQGTHDSSRYSSRNSLSVQRQGYHFTI